MISYFKLLGHCLVEMIGKLSLAMSLFHIHMLDLR